MRFGSLFSGIGGLDLGLERAGMECAWQVEIDEWCQRVLAKHWPNVPRYGDIREIEEGTLESVDLVCGGFPCQPVSLVGQRQGQSDERWLWPDFARVIRMVRPRYVLVENVSGLLSSGMGEVLGELSSLGYDAEWESLPAAAFGAPHLRWRVFIVAYAYSPGGWQDSRGAPCNEGQDEGGTSLHHYQPTGHGQDVAYAKRTGLQGGAGSWRSREGGAPGVFASGRKRPGGVWEPEPDVRRVDHGIPNRIHRLRGLGNAVVPQVAQWIGERILEGHQEEGAA